MEKERNSMFAFLKSYRMMRAEGNRMEDKIKDLEALSCRATQQLTGMPGGGGKKGGSNVWDTLADMRSQAVDLLQKSLDRCREIEGFLDRVPTDKYRLILKYHYIDGMVFTRIAEVMNYNERHIRRMHESALAEAQTLWNSLFGETTEESTQFICASTGVGCSYCTPGPCSHRRGI